MAKIIGFPQMAYEGDKGVKQNISKQRLKKEIMHGKTIRIFRDGEIEELNEEGLLNYLKDMFMGGKTLTMAEKEMIKDGIKDNQWKTRDELIGLLQQIALGEDLKEAA